MPTPRRSERLLTQWESDTRLIGLFLATGLIRNTRAQSLLLVGPYGEGKSELLRRFRFLPTVKMVSDVTPNGIRRLLEEDTGHRVRHYLITEFARVQFHDFAVSSQAAVLFANLMSGDGGVEVIGRDKAVDLTNRQLGLIAAMTTDMFAKQKDFMEASGLLSRFTILPVYHDNEERDRILEAVAADDDADKAPIDWARFHLPAPVDVKYAPGLKRSLLSWFTEIDLKGTAVVRRLDTAKSLLLAVALLNGRTHTTPEDLEILKRFSGYFKSEKGTRLLWPIHDTNPGHVPA